MQLGELAELRRSRGQSSASGEAVDQAVTTSTRDQELKELRDLLYCFLNRPVVHVGPGVPTLNTGLRTSGVNKREPSRDLPTNHVARGL